MSYKKFESSDIFINTVKATPHFKIKINSGVAMMNNKTTGFVQYGTLNTNPPVPVVGCSNPNSFDFSCEENSYNVGAI